MSSVTKEESEFSAIGSWAGYIYQGLCALYHVLKLVCDDKEKYADYQLSLDAFEDFAILDGDSIVVSLHQCKDAKAKKDFTHEFEKMKEKWSNLLWDAKCVTDCHLYFHSNHLYDVPENIELYDFNGKNTCSPGEIFNLLKGVVEKVCNKYKVEGFQEYILAKLVNLVEQEVLVIQQEFFESKKKLKELARKHVLPFHRFLAIIFDADIPLDFNRKEVFVSFLRSRYIMNLRQRMEEELEYGSQVNEEQLIVFIDSFVKLTTEQTMEFFQRICPCEKIDSGLEGCLRLASEEKINTLFNQINSLEVLIPDGLHWVQEEKKQTPSTLGADRNVRQFCVRIFNNAANLDKLREYDQIIGCVTDSVENIRECVYNIKHSDIEKDPNNIFEINKIGILKLEDRIRS